MKIKTIKKHFKRKFGKYARIEVRILRGNILQILGYPDPIDRIFEDSLILEFKRLKGFKGSPSDRNDVLEPSGWKTEV